MGNSNSKQIGTKEIVTGLGIISVGIIGAFYWSNYAQSSKRSSRTSQRNSKITSNSESSREGKNVATPSKIGDEVVHSSQYTSSSNTSENTSENTSVDKRRQTIYFKSDDLLPTDGWVEYSIPNLGVKFKHPKDLNCTLGVQDTLSIITFNNPNSSENNLQFMTIETQAEKVDPKNYSKNAIQLIRNVFPHFVEKVNRVFDFQGNDAYELQYQMYMQGKNAEVWTTSISGDHASYLMQCMSADGDAYPIKLSKTILSTLEIGDLPSVGKVEVTTNCGLKIALPALHLRVQKPSSGSEVLKAIFSTSEEPLVEQLLITKYDNTSIDQLLEILFSKFGDSVEEIANLQLKQFTGNILKWSDENYEYIGYIFEYADVGYIVQYQIEESRLNQAFQKRAIESVKSIEFVGTRNELSAVYVHPKFTVKAPIGTPLREIPLPLVVQFHHSTADGQSIHTTVEFRELEIPVHSIEEFDRLLRERIDESMGTPEQEIIEINGRKAVKSLITTEMPDYTMMMMGGESKSVSCLQTTFLDGNQNVIAITSTCLKEEYEKFKSAFDEIHQSFSF